MNVTINVPLEAVLILGALILIQIIAKVIVCKTITKHSKELSDKRTKAICNMMQPFTLTLIQFHNRKSDGQKYRERIDVPASIPLMRFYSNMPFQ